MSETDSVATIVGRHLSAYLGQHTAPMAIKTFAKQAIGVAPDQLHLRDATKLLDAMRPMLSTLIGKQRAEEVVTLIRRDLGV
jgi:hypothetical protein